MEKTAGDWTAKVEEGAEGESKRSRRMKVRHLRDGVVLVDDVLPADRHAEACALFLQAAHGPTALGFLPFAHLYTLRLPRQPKSQQGSDSGMSPATDDGHEREESKKEEEEASRMQAEAEEAEAKRGEVEATGDLRALMTEISEGLHQALYGEPDGLWAGLPENGCSEDHEGRRCQCPDRTPLMPRSTELNCVEGLIYRAGARRGYHRDAHWMLALTFGSDVKMGFHRQDDQEPITVTVASGNAVLFNGALHSHAVLGIGDASTAPAWWSYPFARAVFLMRDARQTIGARKRQEARRAAAGEAGKEAAALAAAKLEHPPDV